MVKRFYMYFIVLAFTISMLGCALFPGMGGEAGSNRSNMFNLQIGMSKDQVLAIMGKPYKTEAYQIEGKNLEFWFYLTEGIGVSRHERDSNFTPFALENNVLTGWGRNYYDNALHIKQDVKIEKQ